MNQTWDVFISYSTRDREVVRQVNSDLKRAGLSVWLDEIEIVAGENIVAKIEYGISKSKFFLAFLSRSYGKSAFAREELTSILMTALSAGGNSVIPVRLDNAPIPQLLKARKYCDFRSSYIAGYQELAKALGRTSKLPDFRILHEQVRVRLVPERRLATWDYDRKFEISGRRTELRVLVVHTDVVPTEVWVSPGELQIERVPGFFALNATYDPPLREHTPLRQQIHYELEDVYGDPHDYWFYSIPTSFGSCEITLTFPGHRIPTHIKTEFERDGFRTPGPVLARSTSGSDLVYRCRIEANESEFRQVFFEWDW